MAIGLDDPTEISDGKSAKACEFILQNIMQVYKNANEWDLVSEEFEGLSLEQTHSLITTLPITQSADIKQIGVSFSKITDPSILVQLYDIYQTYPKQQYNGNQNIYFVEGGLSAIIIIPIKTSDGTITIIMQLLDSSSYFIKNIWEGKRKTQSLDEISQKYKLRKASQL